MRGALALPSSPALLLAVAPAAPVPKDGTAPLYYPTKVGTKWTYGVNSHTLDGWELTTAVEVITAVEREGRAKVVTVCREFEEGRTVPVEKVLVSEKGLFQVGRGTETCDPPLPLLKLPHRPGDR